MTLRFMTSGESHGPALVAVLEGLPAGLKVDVAQINHELERRQKGYGAGPRMKLETDTVRILGGVMEGVTIGAPLAMTIDNLDHSRWAGKAVAPFSTPRPGHADLTGAIKYGFTDMRPALERASARETAARVAVGAVCKALLAHFGVTVGGYVISIGQVTARLEAISLEDRIRLAEKSDVRCPDQEAAIAMDAAIADIMQARNTLGGVIEVLGLGVPPGLGSYSSWDNRLETRIGAAILSVQAVKGVEIGPAFENAHLMGTQVQDPIRLEGLTIVRPTNRAGGLEGGITNGEPVVVRAAMKPIATTLTTQLTVDLSSGIESDTHYERSDFCPVPRAVPVLEAMLAFVLANALLEKLGGDSLAEMAPRFAALRLASVSDLTMDGQAHMWWPE